MPNHPLDLRVSASENGPRYLPEVLRGVTADGAVRTIHLRALEATVRGRVVDYAGAGVAQVCVATVIEAPPSAWAPVLTDAEGRFVLLVPSSGEVELAA